jgi:hypothetical protein
VSRARPGLGTETLRQLTDLQRQAGERVAPLSERQKQRQREHARRVVLRTTAALVPLVLAAGLAVDVGGSRDWLGDRWSDLSNPTTGQKQPAEHPAGY